MTDFLEDVGLDEEEIELVRDMIGAALADADDE